ncbi:hypothetical protein G6F68_021211 [Rhizopus microsporus]|nr:hypothetical protein G6F68_021211 [Rhizopus microsporus]
MTTSSGISAAWALTIVSVCAVPLARTVKSACARISEEGFSVKRPFDSATRAAPSVAITGRSDKRSTADVTNKAPSSTSQPGSKDTMFTTI